MGNCVSFPRQPMGSPSLAIDQVGQESPVANAATATPMTRHEFIAALDQWVAEAPDNNARDQYTATAKEILVCFDAGRDAPQSIEATRLFLFDKNLLCSLPTVIGELTALQTLYVMGCHSLRSLPDSIGNLTALQTLNLTSCDALKKLPENIGNLTALQILTLNECGALETLPESFGNLTALQTLNLDGCLALEDLPESFGNLTALQTLELIVCRSLKNLPENIGNLTALQTLKLDHCHALRSLPDSIGRLRHLRHLNLENNGYTRVFDVLLELPADTEILLRNNNLPEDEIRRVRGLVAERQAQGLQPPQLILPRLPEDIDQENTLRRLAEGGMNVHAPELTATLKLRIDELAAQFPDHLRGNKETQNRDMLAIKARLEQLLQQYGAGDEPARKTAERMFAVGLGKDKAYANDFHYSPGHVLSYVMLALERQWKHTPEHAYQEAHENGAKLLIEMLKEATGFCDTRLINQVFQIVGAPLSTYAEQHPEIVEAKPVALSHEQVRDTTLPIAISLLAKLEEQKRAPSSSSQPGQTREQLQETFRQELTAEVRRDHPNIKAQQLSVYIDELIGAWDDLEALALEKLEATPKTGA
ncbi:MAG: leucine-rich repeat domain-containing protein [Burkholderiaceae bacterium]